MISVLVVDDSVVVRRLISNALADSPDIEVIGTAANGRFALDKIDRLKPDLVTMDIEMPEMDGLVAVRELRKKHSSLPVIMFSALTAAGASATLDALAAGATDYVTKPSNNTSIEASVAAIREQLVPRIHALNPRRTPRRVAPVRPTPVRPAPIARQTDNRVIDIVAIGASTGGPEALATIISQLPADLRVPVAVVQHMPPVFTKMFAQRLDRASQLRVVEAEDGMPATAGTVLIAPGDKHLILQRRGAGVVARLTDGPPVNSCRPAVDVLFRSVREIYGETALSVVLTGMGKDGRDGCAELRAAGAEIVAQDEASSVVWGMPGAVVNAGLAHEVLPLNEIRRYLISRVAPGRVLRSKVVT